jgi:hypothetical protein
MYDPQAVGDHLVPPPQRNAVEPAIQAMVQGLMEADRDLKSVMGLFEPSLGERGRQESGKAITAMQQQGDIANSNYLDNLQRTKRSIGRALLEWFPVIYDTPRLMHLLQPDGKKIEAVIHAGEDNKPRAGEFPEDITHIFDISVGHYDVTVSTGPSYQSERQATEAWLLDLFKVLPGLGAIGADIVLENSDNPAAQQLAARAKLAIDPRYLDPKDPETELPRLQAENAQLKQLVETAKQAVTALAETIQTKALENTTKKEVAIINAQAALSKVAMELASAQDMAQFNAAFKQFTMTAEQIHQTTLLEMQHSQTLTQEAESAKAQSMQQDQKGQQQAALEAQKASQTSAQSAQDATQQALLAPPEASRA